MLSTTRYGLAALFCLILLCQSSARPAQNPVRTDPQTSRPQLPPSISDQTYRVNVDLINIFCSVWNKDTKSFVTNLAREDFAVFEDGQKQEIKNFARETNMPLTIALLVDTSQSVAPKLKFEQEAATNFFYTVLKQNDRAMLVEFDSSVSMVQDFTSDTNKLAKQIRAMQAAGNTALYDAIVKTCDEKLIRETGRKTIVILSDGEDSASNETFQRAREMAMNAEATIFSISIDTREGDKVLTQLAFDTGGKAFFPFLVEELDANFREIALELRSQYNIGYISSNPRRDGSYRKIEVKLAERNMKLNFKKGYFSPTGGQ
jgi:Ca-activated chloride channel family protein